MKPVSDTAFYCCGARMVDAESTNPVCGDTYARLFMEGRGLEVFQRFRDFKHPNASNVARARLIDDLVRDDLAQEPGRLVITLGAGFDSRPYRLGGGRWVELDEPAVMSVKEERLPASESPRPLTRVPIDFERESLAEKLAPFAGESQATVILEGVMLYLQESEKLDTLQALVEALPGHVILVDLMTKRFFDKFGYRIHRELAGMGASFQDMSDQPDGVLHGLGYRTLGSWSTVEAAKRFGSVSLPWFLLRTVLKTLATGYRVHRLQAPQGQRPSA